MNQPCGLSSNHDDLHEAHDYSKENVLGKDMSKQHQWDQRMQGCLE